MSKPYAEVIGDPIAHSKSPLIHNFWLEKLGIDAEYRATHVKPEELADYFENRRADPDWRGCNVTAPHKLPASAFADSSADVVQAVGATNTVARSGRKLIAGNTDIEGIAAALRNVDLEGGEPCVIGSGGAARAAFHVLSGYSTAAVLVLSRQPERAVEITRPFSFMGVGVPLNEASYALSGAPLLINASPMGMVDQQPQPREVLESLALMDSNALVFDMVYAPLETELLRVANASGRRTADGLTMLVAQAASAFRQFFDRPAPRQYDTELRKLLTA